MVWKGDWACLPTVALTEIYTYLKDSDKAHMALACQHWHQVFTDPCLWTERHFRFGGYRSNKRESDRALGYARAHGASLKVLHIRCDHPGFSACKRFQRALSSLVNCLIWRRAQLREVNISQLNTERYWRLGDIRQRLVTCLSRFFRRQCQLQVVDISDAGLQAEGGLNVLDAMTQHSGPSLRNLDLQDFFQLRIAASHFPLYVEIMSRFRQLHTLHINYSYINDDIIRILTTRCAQTIRVLNIKVSRSDPHNHTIDNTIWWKVRRVCPLLRVVLSLEGVVAYDDVTRILPRHLPLYSLNLWTGIAREDEPPHRLTDMMRYLADRFGEVLEELSMSLENRWEPVDSALLEMLPRCRQLTVLELSGILEVDTVDTICDLEEEYKIGLLRCHITFENLTFDEVEELNDVILQHDDMIEERGLDFEFTATQHPYM